MKTQMAWAVLITWIFSVSAQSEGNESLLTHQYTVPPTFFSEAPIYINSNLSFQERMIRLTAEEILKQAGIKFDEGARAEYLPATSNIIVTNTSEQLAQVEKYIESIQTGSQIQAYITFSEMVFSNESFGKFLVNLDNELNVHTPWIQNESLGISGRGILAGYLSAKQLTKFSETAIALQGVTRTEPVSIMVRSNSSATIQKGKRNFGVSVALIKKQTQADLSLYLPPPGENLIRDPNILAPDFKATVRDGQTAVIKRKTETGVTLAMITARLLDPAGKAINQ